MLAYDAPASRPQRRGLAGQRDQALTSSAPLKRLDVTSRSLIALIEPGSCFAGSLLELAWHCDRQYMLDGVLEDGGDASRTAAAIVL